MADSSPAPVVETVVAATPVADAAPTPVVEKAAVVETPVAPVATAVEKPAQAPADLLAPDTKPEVEAKPEAPSEPVVEKPAEAPKEPIVYGDPPALPEGLSITKPEAFAEKVKTFDGKLGDLEAKFGVSHEAAQAFRQEVLTLAFNEIADITRRSAESVTSAAAEARRQIAAERATQTQTWRQEFEDDPTLSGNHRETTLFRANAVIDEYAADRTLPPAQRKAQTESLKAALKESGLQNHPAMVRLLRNVGNDLVEGKPVPALKAAAPPQSKAQKLYRSG